MERRARLELRMEDMVIIMRSFLTSQRPTLRQRGKLQHLGREGSSEQARLLGKGARKIGQGSGDVELEPLYPGFAARC